MKRQQQISEETMERVERWAKAFRLDPDALIEAAITMTVPMEVGDTATPNEIELNLRAGQLGAKVS